MRYPLNSTWLSYSSISNFEKCLRLYFLHEMYHDSKGKRIEVVSPSLTLGIAVHNTIEEIRYLPREIRFARPLTEIFEEIWTGYHLHDGGFSSEEEEMKYKARGIMMVKRVMDYPGPLANLSTVIKPPEEKVSSMLLSEEDRLILCGNLDWIEVLPDESVHIIDFKTGKNEEDTNSLQLQIYLLLAQNKLKRPVTKLSYWYLDHDNEPREAAFPNMDEAKELLMFKGKEISRTRALGEESMYCRRGGCRDCTRYEAVKNNLAEFVKFDAKMNKNNYYYEEKVLLSQMKERSKTELSPKYF